MCDTFFSPSRFNKNGHAIFAKNSDREPNEAQQIVCYPRQLRPDKKINTTFISVDCPEMVHEVILSKPFQMWGAEMGINEYGVVIGNEAVFTKIKISKKNAGLTGMDMLRLALEQASTATQAVTIILNLLEKYGQDACGGYEDKNMFYHNSFIIADPNEAFILETAGKFWVKKVIKQFSAISNILSIEDDYDEIQPEAIAFAIKKGWAKPNETFSFKEAFLAPIMSFLAQGKHRRYQCISQGSQEESNNNFTLNDAFSILRSHRNNDHFEPQKGTMGNVCLHATGLFTPSQTTGSMVVELRKAQPPTVWLTGTAAPCLSFFKPFYLGTSILNENFFTKPKAQLDNSYWWQWEVFHRKCLRQYPSMVTVLKKLQTEIENHWIAKDHELIQRNDADALAKFSQSTIEESLKLKDSLIFDTPPRHLGFFYQNFWQKQNKKANL